MTGKIYYKIRGVAGCLMLASLLGACTQEELATQGGDHGARGNAYVSLSFTMPAQGGTRSNPNGGEQADGREQGQDYESEINSVVAFFYKDSDSSGVNGDPKTPIALAAEFKMTQPGFVGSIPIDRTYTTEPLHVDLENGQYQVLVVVNPHGAVWWKQPGLNLGQVRDHIEEQAWRENAEGFSDFTMTSAQDAILNLNSNPKEKPATAEVSVARVAARLDYKAENSYSCTDPNYANATVSITGAALVNNLKAGSYLIKRVSDNVSDNPKYLGQETADGQGAATNYVLDPWTASKTEGNNNFTIGTSTNQPASALYGVWFESGSKDPSWWSEYVKPGVSIGQPEEGWKRIGYTLENTTAQSEAGSRYSTAVVFSARFNPQGISHYKPGSTFFAYGSVLYASLEDLMSHFYGEKFSIEDGFREIDACTTWAELQQFVNSVLLPNDPTGYDDYLSDLIKKAQESGSNIDEVTKGKLGWKYYMLYHCGYSCSWKTDKNKTASVILDQNKEQLKQSTREILQPFGVRTYKDAVCYYTWWVRHANDNDDSKKGIMEYAIVRNNIYKLIVKSIYSLGGDVPEKEENILLDVYVNNWLLLPPETLPM